MSPGSSETFVVSPVSSEKLMGPVSSETLLSHDKA